MKESGETVAIVKPPATSSSMTGLAVGQWRCGEACPPLCWWMPHGAGYVSRGPTNGRQDRMESVPDEKPAGARFARLSGRASYSSSHTAADPEPQDGVSSTLLTQDATLQPEYAAGYLS